MKDLESFLKRYPTRTYPKGTIIMHQGDEPGCAYVIKKGIVKTYDITNEGEERPIMFDRQNDILPIGWVFGYAPGAIYFYEAFTDSVLYLVPREDYLQFIKTHGDAQFEVFRGFVARHLDFQARILGLEQTKASDKVLHTLGFLSSRFGQRVNDKVVKLRLPLTQKDMAGFIGLTRETTGIELKKLERKGIIKYYQQKYTVYTKKLRELLRQQ